MVRSPRKFVRLRKQALHHFAFPGFDPVEPELKGRAQVVALNHLRQFRRFKRGRRWSGADISRE